MWLRFELTVVVVVVVSVLTPADKYFESFHDSRRQEKALLLLSSSKAHRLQRRLQLIADSAAYVSCV